MVRTEIGAEIDAFTETKGDKVGVVNSGIRSAVDGATTKFSGQERRGRSRRWDSARERERERDLQLLSLHLILVGW